MNLGKISRCRCLFSHFTGTYSVVAAISSETADTLAMYSRQRQRFFTICSSFLTSFSFYLCLLGESFAKVCTRITFLR